MKAMCEEEIIPADYPPYGYNCHGGYEFLNGTGNILNSLLIVEPLRILEFALFAGLNVFLMIKMVNIIEF